MKNINKVSRCFRYLLVIVTFWLIVVLLLIDPMKNPSFFPELTEDERTRVFIGLILIGIVFMVIPPIIHILKEKTRAWFLFWLQIFTVLTMCISYFNNFSQGESLTGFFSVGLPFFISPLIISVILSLSFSSYLKNTVT